MTKFYARSSRPAFILAAFILFLLGAAAPRLSAQINIGAGGFNSTTVCPSTSVGQNCVIATNGSATVPDNGVLRLTGSTAFQVSSAWSVTPQTVTNGFTSSFTFVLSNGSLPPADGLAFVIQNSGSALGALGVDGGALGYGDDDGNANLNSGISNSLAIEFDTWDNTGWDPNANHVAIQSCRMGPNTSHHNQICPDKITSTLGINANPGATFAGGNVHTITVQYNKPGTPCYVPAAGAAGGNLCVYIDQTNTPALFVNTDLSTLGLNNGMAYVGFTAATGAAVETHDVLTFNFAPTIVQPFNPNGTTTSDFTANGSQNTQSFDTTTANGALTCSTGGDGTQDCANVQLKTTNTTISASQTWPYYVVGTPWSISTCAAKPANGGSDTCSLFVNACFGGPIAEANASDIYCPTVNTQPDAGNTITFTDTWDPLNPKVDPAAAPGTTVSLIDFVPTSATNTWSPSPDLNTPNSACTGTTSNNFACEMSDSLVDMYGDQTTTRGSKPKKGWLISVFNVPMNLTSVNVLTGGACSSPKSPLNNTDTSGATTFEDPNYAANIWNNGDCLLDFGVHPAAIPAFMGNANTNLFSPAPTASFVYGKGPMATDGDVTLTNGNLTAPAFWDTATNLKLSDYLGADGSFVIHWFAIDNVGITERRIRLLADQYADPNFPTCPNTTDKFPCYATTLFTTIVNVDSTLPTISANVQNGSFALNSKVYPMYSCTDPLANNVASGLSTCAGVAVPPTGSACTASGNVTSSTPLDTSTPGAHNYNVSVTDCAGNTNTTNVTYNVTAASADVALFQTATGSTKRGSTLNAIFWALDLSSNAAQNVVITVNLPTNVAAPGTTAKAGIVTCTLLGCNNLTGGTNCNVSASTATCNIGTLNSVLKITGAVVNVSIPISSSAAVGTKFTVSGNVMSANDPNSRNNSTSLSYTVSK